MGSAVSKNITKAATEAISKVSNRIISDINVSSDQTQIISVVDVKGDVTISGNTFSQKATINMKSLMNALAQEDIQQELVYDIAQSCKSIVSELNIFQFANATNDINIFLKASAELMTTISQSCAASISQNQTISVSKTVGNVKISGNVLSEMADIFSSCVQNAVSKNSIYQSLEEKVSQTASASAEGVSLWQIIILVAMVIGGVPLVAIVAGFKFLYPVCIIAGAGCMVAWNQWVNDEIVSHAFSTLIESQADCNGIVLNEKIFGIKTSNIAGEKCAEISECVAFDWKGTTVLDDYSHAPISEPETIFYKKVEKKCEENIHNIPDRTNVFRRPIFSKDDKPPTTSSSSDVHLDTSNTDYYFRDQETKLWNKHGSFAHEEFTNQNKIDWGTTKPNESTQERPGNIYVYYDKNNPIYFYLYVKKPDKWELYTPNLRGPGMIPNAPEKINVTGFKKKTKRKQWLLVLGGSLLVVGLLGSLSSLKSKKK